MSARPDAASHAGYRRVMKGRRGIIRFSTRHWRHRRQGQWRSFLLLCLVTAGAWAIQIDFRGDVPVASTPTVLRGGEAWQGEGTPRRKDRGAGVLTGSVTHVRDGDTIEVSGTPVRIANLDCAERGTPAGDRAAQRMRELARQSSMRCHLSGQHSYDRKVGTCQLSGGRDVGAVLVAEGLCTRWR